MLGNEMMHVNNKKNKTIVTTAAASLFTLAVFVVAAGAITSSAPYSPSAEASIEAVTSPRIQPYAPMAVSEDGNNVYIVWWTNKSENWEVMFRASNDAGATFGDKINLSNSTDTDSQNAEIVAAGNNVYVSWWETSPITGSSESVLRVSTDNGQTFGPMIMLGTNGTITTAAAAGGAVEEEVGGTEVAE
jgi:hypothetical protein